MTGPGCPLMCFPSVFLVKRPLLQALEPDPAGPPVLLIDELDRTDEAFEAFLLEILSDFQATIPELGTIKAPAPPIVIITSNRTREVHDALKRRCLYHWVDYPDTARELAILKEKARGRRRNCPSRLWPMCRPFVRKTCSRFRAWPKRWIGLPRWSSWMPWPSIRRWFPIRSGCS